MKVLEIKNNLVKVINETEEKLVLAGFVVIDDDKTPYVGQIMSLKADGGISYAIVKLLFTFDTEGIVRNYDGSIPKLEANVNILDAKDLLEILPVQTPVKLGKLAQQEFLLSVDRSIIQNNLLICSDSAKNTATLVSNFAKQIENNAESSVIFDIDGKYKEEKKFVFGKDFKLPLNFDSINFIYGNDLTDVDSTSRAVIQDIFLEIQDYTRTIPEKFIPFDTFIDVVSQQYTESGIPELALLKNKLLKYKEENVFAQSKYEIISLKEYIRDNYTTIIDISNIDANLQREVISYVYSVLEDMNASIYTFVKVTDKNSDKKLLKQLLNENKIYTNLICNHNYKYVYELKAQTDNLILFAPETTRHDFASYNTFLNKLNHDEFVVWGNSTQRIPLIIELSPIELIKDEPIYMTETEIPEESYSAEEDEDIDEASETSYIQPVVPPQTDETPHAPEHDFTENEDTYTDLSDDIERKPQEEEDYSALSSAENIEYEETDDFDAELDKSIEEDLQDPNSLLMNTEEEEELQEAPANDFFTKAEPDEASEVDTEEVIMPDGEIIEEYNDASIPPDKTTSAIEIEQPEELYLQETNASQIQQEPELQQPEMLSEPDMIEPEAIEEIQEDAIETFPLENQIEQQIDFEEPELVEQEGESFIEEEKTPQPQINLPDPEMDERIEQDLNSAGDEEGFESEAQAPYENEQLPDTPELMTEDEDLNNALIEQVAKDVDQTFIYNKIQEDNIDTPVSPDVLTEDDLNFIDNINHGENEILEPVVDTPENFDDNQDEPDSDEENNDAPSQVVPVYPANTPVTNQTFEQGDHVTHPKYGEGIVEKMIKYGEKTLCSINFVNVGRRLLDPAISEIAKL